MAYTTIDKPSDYFNTKLYTGNGSTQSITGVGFQPDMSWTKVRSETGSHRLVDAVRGNTKFIYPNGTDAEATVTTNVTSFDSDGYTLGNGSINESARTYVAWNWLAGGSASSNSNGSITSTVSANTTSGFSIVSYTGNGSAGATVGHGVGSALDMIIVKKRSSTAQWVVGHKAMDSTFDNFLFLDSDSAKGNADNVFNDTAPTSSVFSIGNAGDTNASGQTYIAYCFADVKGYSKFGSYTGGGSNFPFIYTGFKPSWLMVKNTSNNARNWTIIDNKRNPFNPEDEWLYANASDSTFDASSYPTDFVSNGFKIRNTGSYFNTSGENYIYMAFAENPFVTSTGIPTTAR